MHTHVYLPEGVPLEQRLGQQAEEEAAGRAVGGAVELVEGLEGSDPKEVDGESHVANVHCSWADAQGEQDRFEQSELREEELNDAKFEVTDGEQHELRDERRQQADEHDARVSMWSQRLDQMLAM